MMNIYTEPHDGWYESVFDDFCEICRILGFDVSPSDIRFSGFWSQGDGASFTGSYAYAKGAAERIREYAPGDAELHNVADSLQVMQKRRFYGVTASIDRVSSRYSHENTCRANIGDVGDIDDESVIEDCRRELCQWLYSVLEREYEYQCAWQAGRLFDDMKEREKDQRRETLDLLRQNRESGGSKDLPAIHATIKRAVCRAWKSICESRNERAELLDTYGDQDGFTE